MSSALLDRRRLLPRRHHSMEGIMKRKMNLFRGIPPTPFAMLFRLNCQYATGRTESFPRRVSSMLPHSRRARCLLSVLSASHYYRH